MRAPGPHGGDVVAVARALAVPPSSLLDLSASLNPLAPDVVGLLASLDATAVRSYPDEHEAIRLLADALQVAPDRLVLTNGGAEAIALVAAAHPRGQVEEPAFSLYRRHLADGDAPDGLVWRANPSSPLGRLAPPDATADVWDEAFWPLATGTWTRHDDRAYRLGSLTKLWACPGVRLGYVIAPDAAAAAELGARRPAWSVNGVALALVPALLARTDLVAWQAGIAELRADLAALWRTHGFEVHDTTGPWVLVDGAAALRAPLARHGVLVRDCSSFGLPGTARCAVPDRAGLARLADALAAVRSDR